MASSTLGSRFNSDPFSPLVDCFLRAPGRGCELFCTNLEEYCVVAGLPLHYHYDYTNLDSGNALPVFVEGGWNQCGARHRLYVSDHIVSQHVRRYGTGTNR